VHARHEVGAAARRIGDDQPDGSARVGLRVGRPPYEKQDKEKLFHHSTFTCWMMGRNWSICRLRIASCSAPLEPTGSAAMSRRRLATSGWRTAATTSLLSRSSTSRGVFAGAKK